MHSWQGLTNVVHSQRAGPRPLVRLALDRTRRNPFFIKRKRAQHNQFGDGLHPFFGHSRAMNAELAIHYARTMIHRECLSPGDAEGAMRRLAERYGIGYWTLDYLRRHKAKAVEEQLFQQLEAACSTIVSPMRCG